MNNTNHLISGDNKGLASQLMERYINQGNEVSTVLLFLWSKTTLITGGVGGAGQGWILPLEKRTDFFLGPWL